MPELLFQTSDSRLHQQGLVWTLKLQITKLALIDEIRVSYQNLSFPRSAQVTEMCGHNTFRGESMNMTTDGKLAKLLAKKKKEEIQNRTVSLRLSFYRQHLPTLSQMSSL